MITAIIPARGGSKSIPKKNIVDIGGRPLISYSIDACKRAKNIDRIIVSTEDEEIAEISKSYGAEVPFIRPSELSQDNSTDVGFLKHFFDNIEADEVALIRPTTPFREPEFMDMVIEKYFTIRDNISGLRTVEEINENPYKVYKLKNNICGGFFVDFEGEKDYTNLPRQTFPKAYIGNGHIDIVKKETVFTGTAFGDNIYAEVCEKMIDIDSPFDLKLARLEIQTRKI
jgi:CMP-N,N'-diacetyllegionaminic acid synthase